MARPWPRAELRTHPPPLDVGTRRVEPRRSDSNAVANAGDRTLNGAGANPTSRATPLPSAHGRAQHSFEGSQEISTCRSALPRPGSEAAFGRDVRAHAATP